MVQIKDISPYNEDYSELQAIGDAIGDAKIVMLGEQDHGDAPTFLAKSKIIKYLHEEKGFNVLAFESDFFALNAGWDSLNKTDTAIHTFIRRNIFPLWTACDACQHLLFDYLPATHSSENPLQLSGFDSQIFLWYSYDSLRILLDSVFRLYDLPITKTPEYTGIVLPLIDSTAAWLSPYIDSNQYNTAHQFFSRIKLELMEKVVENDFWLLVIDNLIAANLEFECIGIDAPKGMSSEMHKWPGTLPGLVGSNIPTRKSSSGRTIFISRNRSTTVTKNSTEEPPWVASCRRIPPSLPKPMSWALLLMKGQLPEFKVE
jgi:erythromycin esterase